MKPVSVQSFCCAKIYFWNLMQPLLAEKRHSSEAVWFSAEASNHKSTKIWGKVHAFQGKNPTSRRTVTISSNPGWNYEIRGCQSKKTADSFGDPDFVWFSIGKKTDFQVTPAKTFYKKWESYDLWCSNLLWESPRQATCEWRETTRILAESLGIFWG